MRDKFRITAFLIIIFGLAMACMLKTPVEFSERENRYLAQKPQVSAKEVFDGSFEQDYEEYVTDQFVMRDDWIAVKTTVERAVLKRDINGVYICDDGYLMMKYDHSDFESERLSANLQTIADFVLAHEDRFGSEHLKVMPVPTADQVLTDKLPAFADVYDESRVIDALAQAVGNDHVVNVLPALREHASEYIYYRTDHHWTSLGAYYAYRTWAQECGLTPFEQTDYDVRTVTDDFLGTLNARVNVDGISDSITLYDPKGAEFATEFDDAEPIAGLFEPDALETRDKYVVFLGGNHPRVDIHKNGADVAPGNSGTARRLLVIKDSYAHTFVPLAAGHFDEITMLDLRYYNKKISELIDEGGYTDILILYNISNLASDRFIAKLER